jgi:hydrogenase nickel incorporation protein HypB
MCATCGCGALEAHDPAGAAHAHGPDAGHLEHAHPLADGGAEHEHHLPDGTVLRHRHDGVASRLVRLEHDLLARNDEVADANRARLRAAGTLALNLMSSPGAGKTSLLVRTLEALAGAVPVAVVEGDQETSLDADRIRATGTPAVQVNTGKACHLDANMVARALSSLPALPSGILFVENVGNLVCPAAFDLGESCRVVIVSVTEGEDKPLKYPHMFARADLLLVTKVDLLPHVGLDLPLLLERARQIRPGLETLLLSSRTGEGLDAWLAWLERTRKARVA